MPENKQQKRPLSGSITSDYSFVDAIARVAIYDGIGAAPKVLEITPDKTDQFIEHLTDVVNDEAKKLGGKIPYSAIRQGVENLIHAQFHGCVVSILDGGNTIRIADHGPGIKDIKNAVRPGFTSATEPMQKYIRGVGSGIPLMRDYVQAKHGHININSNIDSGTVLTISVDPDSPEDDPVLEYQQNDEEPQRIFGDVRDGIHTQGSRENLMNRYDERARQDHYGNNNQNYSENLQNTTAQQTQTTQQNNYPNRMIPNSPQTGMVNQQGMIPPTQQQFQNSPVQIPYLNQNMYYQPAAQPSVPSGQIYSQGYPQGYLQGVQGTIQNTQGIYQQPIQQISPAQQISSLHAGYIPTQQPTIRHAETHLPLFQQLKPKEIQVLSVLYKYRPKPIGPSAIQDEIDMSKSTAYNVLEKLTDIGLVKRSGSKRLLTTQGTQVIEEIYRNS